MSDIGRKLALAACALVAPAAQGAEPLGPGGGDWRVDASHLSYVEGDGRVAVAKTMTNLERRLDDGSLEVGIVHDAMSGASPTGALPRGAGAVTYSGPSGAGGFVTGSGGDGTRGRFEDSRLQLGVARERESARTLSLRYGALVSRESDYESFGVDVGARKERTDRLLGVDLGLALTFDTIYRSGSEDTPEPLVEVSRARALESGERRTVDARLGVERVLNRRSRVEGSVGLALSEGYHSDPYKVISAADADGTVVADLHESRPDSRLRTTLAARFVHQIAGSKHSLRLGVRHYRDDWGVVSNTVDVRYRHALTRTQYLEPQLRLYRQGAADFYRPALAVDEQLTPILPESGFASADYRLDALTTATVGVKYGIALGPDTDLRLRAGRVEQRFDTALDGAIGATVLQASLAHRF